MRDFTKQLSAYARAAKKLVTEICIYLTLDVELPFIRDKYSRVTPLRVCIYKDGSYVLFAHPRGGYVSNYRFYDSKEGEWECDGDAYIFFTKLENQQLIAESLLSAIEEAKMLYKKETFFGRLLCRKEIA